MEGQTEQEVENIQLKKLVGSVDRELRNFSLKFLCFFFFLLLFFVLFCFFFPVNREEADNVLNLKEAEWKIKNSGEF